MAEIFDKFNQGLEMQCNDPEVRKTASRYQAHFVKQLELGKQQYCDLELAKERAAAVKFKVLNDLDKYLIEFETNFVQRGGKVIWARNEEEAIREILMIVERKRAKLVVKTKTITAEEIHLYDHLAKAGVAVQEALTGELILRESNENSFHFVNPGSTKQEEDQSAFFHQKWGLPLSSTPQELSSHVRKIVRGQFQKADIGITGANFLVANVGGVALTENEGDALMSVSFPRTHIVIAGIEKVIPSVKDLDLFWPLLASHATGQKISAYNSLVLGPKQEGEIDGPDDMYVVLLDNGRSKLLEKVEQRRALSCIRCGACLNVCPVYQTVGGQAYRSTYGGPIGAVITPYMKGLEDHNHLSFASSLCGRCTEVCPMKINLHELLLFTRNDAVVNKQVGIRERLLMFGWKQLMTHRNFLDKLSAKRKNWLVKTLFTKVNGQDRTLPVIKEKSFKQLWEERKNPGK